MHANKIALLKMHTITGIIERILVDTADHHSNFIFTQRMFWFIFLHLPCSLHSFLSGPFSPQWILT